MFEATCVMQSNLCHKWLAIVAVKQLQHACNAALIRVFLYISCSHCKGAMHS